MEHLEDLRHMRFGAKTKYKRSLYDRIRERRDEEAAKKQEYLNEHAIDPYLIWISLFVCLSTGVGAHVVIPGGGLGHYAQVALLSVLAFFISFVGNKWLFHEGAELVANGSKLALTACIAYLLGMVIFVGSLGFVGTAYESTESLSLRAPLVAIQKAEQTATQTSVGASNLLPVANSIAAWAVSTAQCEERSGCVSGRPGAGPMTAQLRAMATGIRRTVSSLGSGERKRVALANQLQNIASEYERDLVAGGSSNASRARLVKIYSKAQRLLTELENAVPLQAMHGLVRQLRSMPAPAAKPGRMDVRAALNGHAARLEAALGSTSKSSVTLPSFPAPTSIGDAWKNIDRVWIYALISYGFECLVAFAWVLTVADMRSRTGYEILPPDVDFKDGFFGIAEGSDDDDDDNLSGGAVVSPIDRQAQFHEVRRQAAQSLLDRRKYRGGA